MTTNEIKRLKCSHVEDEEPWLEIRRCGYCGHFDEINQACWVVASDGICRDVSEPDFCVLGLKEDSH